MTIAPERNFNDLRNPRTPGGIRRSAGRTGESEGPGHGLHRVGEHDATRAGQSEPGPPSTRVRVAVPPAEGAATPDGPVRPCRRCRVAKPLVSFVLLDDPVAGSRKWATRHWCGDCLVAGGHITAKRLHAHVAAERQAHAEELEERRALAAARRAPGPDVAAKIREHETVNDLLDRAYGDEAFAAALVRAAELVHLVNQARAEREQAESVAHLAETA